MKRKPSPGMLAAQIGYWHRLGDPLAIKLVDSLGEALRDVGRQLTEHMRRVEAERDYTRQYRRQQHQLRADVIRQCAGMRRRQR